MDFDSCPSPPHPLPIFWACLVVPLSQKVALSRLIGNSTLNTYNFPSTVFLYRSNMLLLFLTFWSKVLHPNPGKDWTPHQWYTAGNSNGCSFNPKGGGGGVQKCPLVRRSPVISHRIMLWSQKFLTLSINISTKRY